MQLEFVDFLMLIKINFCLLNHKIHEEEVANGLWEKKSKKKKEKASIVTEPKSNYGQEKMF